MLTPACSGAVPPLAHHHPRASPPVAPTPKRASDRPLCALAPIASHASHRYGCTSSPRDPDTRTPHAFCDRTHPAAPPPKASGHDAHLSCRGQRAGRADIWCAEDQGLSMSRSNRGRRAPQWAYTFSRLSKATPTIRFRSGLKELRSVVVLQDPPSHLPSTCTDDPKLTSFASPRGKLMPSGVRAALMFTTWRLGCGLWAEASRWPSHAGLFKRSSATAIAHTTNAEKLGHRRGCRSAAPIGRHGLSAVLVTPPMPLPRDPPRRAGRAVMDGEARARVFDAARRVRARIGALCRRPDACKEVSCRHATPRCWGAGDHSPCPDSHECAKGHRRVGGDRLAGAQDDGREPRRGVCSRQPSAAPAGLCLLQRGRQPAGGARLPVAGRTRFSRFHAHRSEQPRDLARHPGGQSRRSAEAVAALPPGGTRWSTSSRSARRRAGRPDPRLPKPCHLAYGAPRGCPAARADTRRPRPLARCTTFHFSTCRR